MASKEIPKYHNKHSPKERSFLPFSCYTKQIDTIFLSILGDAGAILRSPSSS